MSAETPYSEADALRLASELAAATGEALKEYALGVIVHGSLVLGDFRPGRSDIDLLAVAATSPTADQRERLVDLLLETAKGWPGRVDYRIVLESVAAHPTPEPPMALWLEIDPGRLAPVTVSGPVAGELDLAVELSVCRENGRSLIGAPAVDLIGEVPRSWVVRAGRVSLERWLRSADQPVYRWHSVLTACRIWRFAEEGTHCAKFAAARWALRRNPSLKAVRDVLDRRELLQPDQKQLLVFVLSQLGDAPA